MAKETFTKKIKSELKKGLPKNIKAQISAQINSKLNSRLAARINESAQMAAHKASETATKTAQKTVKIASDTAQIAAETAKHSLDQVLLGLEHRGFKVKENQDLQDIQVMAQKVGQKVLERAEAIRAQIATSPFSPAWLKDVKISTTFATAEKPVEKPAHGKSEASVDGDVKNAAAASSLTEATVSSAAEDVQPETLEARLDSTKSAQDENDEDIAVFEKPAKKSKRENTSRSTKTTTSTRAEK